jgi:hypothetical protein
VGPEKRQCTPEGMWAPESYGEMSRCEGRTLTVHTGQEGSPCYTCVYIIREMGIFCLNCKPLRSTFELFCIFSERMDTHALLVWTWLERI